MISIRCWPGSAGRPGRPRRCLRRTWKAPGPRRRRGTGLWGAAAPRRRRQRPEGRTPAAAPQAGPRDPPRRRRRRGLEGLRRAQGTRGAAALERAAAAAVREELLPVLQIGWIHFEEGRAAGVSGLQHVRPLKLGAEGREEGALEPGPGLGARGAGRMTAKTVEQGLSPGLRLRQPGSPAPSFQLRWGAKFTLKRWRLAKGAVCTLPCLQSEAPSSRRALLKPGARALARRTRRQDAAPALSRRPEPTRAGVAQSRSGFGLRRQEAGQSRPPPPAQDLQPPIPGAQDHRPQTSLALPGNSEPPAGTSSLP
ncbi:uncharacterized protein LOC121010842 [Herpailurus yagouaroundi]|uniref:uncharacterized protein LOC121010842 n=1 Tax=Herpailurus yagouaroundi TaxID=1608482 RepID=UPI001AD6EF30|nr:uncharacterized protein LOC121010842 [Puma yagouaroundi]